MIVTHVLPQVLAMTAEHYEAANFLQVIRRAVFGFLAIVFVLGGLVGFFIGKSFGRRT